MPNIKIVGETGQRDHDSVKDLVIQLGGNWYYKHDDANLVKIKTPGGGYRLYRKNSALIVKTLNNGEYAKKSDCIKLADDSYLLKNHPDTVKLPDDTYTHRSFCVSINNKLYLKSDERVVRCSGSDNYQLKDNCILLDEGIYGKGKYYQNTPEVIQLNGKWLLSSDIRDVLSYDKATGKIVSTPTNKYDLSSSRMLNQVFYKFKDGSNPQLGRYDYGYAQSDQVTRHEITGILVLKEFEKEFNRIIEELQQAESNRITENARKKCNKNFSDAGDDENTAKNISPNYETWGGKQNLFGKQGAAVYSPTFKKTGGIGYTFGVEFETSAGVLDATTAKKLGLLAVGDRSIGAAEYVTGILQGDAGLDLIEKYCEALAAQTFIDDRCSIHVHVGSPEISGATEWKINFDKRFAIGAIKLGTLIEEELYQMLPKSRNPYNRHCHSIARYQNISEANWREHLGTFVFGPEENWGRTLDMRSFKYGDPGRTKDSGLNTWCGGRYKWLNLVRAYSNCSSPTIEYRIWSPSLVYEKVKNFILLSLAFTYVADNCHREIMKGLDLAGMIHLAYHDYPKIEESLLAFIKERKDKFKRNIVYSSTNPESLLQTTIF